MSEGKQDGEVLFLLLLSIIIYLSEVMRRQACHLKKRKDI